MVSDPKASLHFRPHALIADDSRIVRATLSKHLSDLFDFSEALDGEEAWEYLLRNDSVDLLITDLTMPRLDGCGLLRRMRASRSERLREMPVVVISGSDDVDERRQVMDAGATDIITKGMPTGQLLSRLTLLAGLVAAQRLYADQSESAVGLAPYAFQSAAESLLAHAQQHRQNLALLSLSFPDNPALADRILPELKQAIRQTDLLACTGPAEFAIATAGLDSTAARGFAERLCHASRAVLAARHGVVQTVCCGVATLADLPGDPGDPPALHAIWDAARQRCRAGIAQRSEGAIGAAEESALRSQ